LKAVVIMKIRRLLAALLLLALGKKAAEAEAA